MATPTPTNNIWYYRTTITRDGQTYMYGTFLRNFSTPAITDYFNFCQDMLLGQEAAGKTLAKAKALSYIQYFFTSHSLQAIYPVRNVPLVRAPDGTGYYGTRSGSKLPGNVQVAVQRKSANGTRHGYGVLKPPFGVSDDISGTGNWLPSLTTDVGDWANQMISLFSGVNPGNQLLPCLWDRNNPTVTIDFRNYNVGAYPRVIRRRTVGVGI